MPDVASLPVTRKKIDTSLRKIYGRTSPSRGFFEPGQAEFAMFSVGGMHLQNDRQDRTGGALRAHFRLGDGST